ncbi:hypothetical protein GCM10009430_15230 [Aquimarina litoralis]|uniref:DUF541 domain-containing protein n=1 Tax=Aquimarina litoralis TaxID=584605 RepID=A0ABP3TXN9_9FLAO
MKFYILFLFSGFFIASVFAQDQDITLRVLGQSNYVEYAESNVAMISINESDIDKIDTLNDSIANLGFNSKLSKIEEFKNPNKVQFKIEDEDISRFDQLLVWFSDLQINVEKIYFRIPEHRFEEEDKNAILALNNANSQAKIIANHLGYKVYKILNIDDETTYAHPVYDDFDFDSETGVLMLRLLELLGGNSLFKTESLDPIRNGGYSLWVTYRLTMK